jgi:hypothetical protein
MWAASMTSSTFISFSGSIQEHKALLRLYYGSIKAGYLAMWVASVTSSTFISWWV